MDKKNDSSLGSACEQNGLRLKAYSPPSLIIYSSSVTQTGVGELEECGTNGALSQFLMHINGGNLNE